MLCKQVKCGVCREQVDATVIWTGVSYEMRPGSHLYNERIVCPGSNA